jgi:ABC-type branched-subunit amino acid transport system substrate-binding protein
MLRTKALLAASTLTLLAAASCSSGTSASSSGTSAGTSGASTGASGRNFTIGVLADQSGVGASVGKTLLPGVQAGIALATKEGYHIKYVAADTASSPSTTLAAAQRLVQQDHVSAIISAAALGFAASPFLNSHGIPVIGGASTPEWATDRNMFSVYGPIDTSKPVTTFVKFMKMEGVTNIGVVSYALPTSAATVKAWSTSASAVGLKAGYLNGTLPFGSTNVGPIALGMKSAGVNGLHILADPNTAFSLITAARQQGVNLKVALLPTGYGGDLLQAGPGALQSGQGVYFISSFEPVEMHTAATRQFQNMLQTVGVTSEPTVAEYVGYASVDMLVRGLKAAGPNPTPTSLISSLAGIRDFSAAGLLGNHTLNLAQRSGIAAGPDNCSYITKLSGSSFQLVAGAEPICGTLLAG